MGIIKKKKTPRFRKKHSKNKKTKNKKTIMQDK